MRGAKRFGEKSARVVCSNCRKIVFMRKKLLVAVLVLIGVGIFASIVASAQWHEILAVLNQITFWEVIGFLALAQISYGLFNLRWQIILKTHGHQVPYRKLWLYRALGYGVSYITPTQVGGEPVRIYLLNENHGISLRESTASVLMDKLIELTSFVAFIASGVLVVSFTNLLPQSSLVPIAALVGSVLLLSAYVYKKLLDGTGFLTSCFKALNLHRFERLRPLEGKIFRTEKLIMDFLAHDDHKKTTLPLLAVISLAAWATSIIEYYVIASFLGVELTLYQSFLIGTVPLMAYLIPVPAGLGMLEGAQTGMFALFGLGPSVALAVVLMVRVKELLFSGIGFGYAVTHGLSILGKKKPEPGLTQKAIQKTRSIKQQRQEKKASQTRSGSQRFSPVQ